MKKKLNIIAAFSLLFSSYVAFGWNSVGHRLIAQIAYDQLNPRVKIKVDRLTAVMFHSRYGQARFARAAVWPDRIRRKGRSSGAEHFIDQPILQDGVIAPELPAYNVVSGIQDAEKALGNMHLTEYEHAKALSFLVHFIGDVHQPLHCAQLYNHVFIQGDRGGNLYRIQSPVADNLHQLWDKGVGLFVSDPSHYQFRYNQIEKMALDWMHRYPRSFFGDQLSVQVPSDWALHGYRLAHFAYTLPLNGSPSADYIAKSQLIVQQQVVLAGDRLADVLNRIMG